MTAVEPDYDEDPERFRSARRAVHRYGTAGDVHPAVAARLAVEGLAPVLDVGCGDGALLDAGPPPGWLGVDRSSALLASVTAPVVQADAAALPFAEGSVGAVCALWMLYHLDHPAAAVGEAHRVLRPGGLFAACTSSRNNDPELAPFVGAVAPSTFDAEEAADVVAAVFGAVEVERWDGVFVRLPDRPAVEDYLLGRGASVEGAADVAAAVTVPLELTKRGVLVWGRRAG